MELIRYSTEELQKLCKSIFYEYMSSVNNDSYDCPTPAHALYRKHQDTLKEYERHIEIRKEALHESCDQKVFESHTKALKYLKEGYSYIKESNMKNQKELYNATNSTNYARTTIRIPLDKKINSYYDDFVLEVAFYDDVTTLNGKFEDYKKLRTSIDRRKFIEDNTEITHLGLLYIRSEHLISIIPIQGELNCSDEHVKATGTILLPQYFSDFNNLSLKDISIIDNNDLKQLIQSKIDLDKENMTELSSAFIRGDTYTIFRSNSYSNGKADLYIRYTCRGTERVYYNLLNLRNLEISPYFNINNYSSYTKAWWDLNTLGGNPDCEKPVIRC